MDHESRQSPVYALAGLAALVGYVVLFVYIPLPPGYGTWSRFLIGLLAFCVGVTLFEGALGLVKFSLKAIVELTTMLLLFANLCICGVSVVMLTPVALPLLDKIFKQKQLTTSDDIQLAMIVAIPIVLFILDVGAFLVLYPLAQVVGTDLEMKD